MEHTNTKKRAGGTEYTAREALLEIESHTKQIAGPKCPQAITMLVGLHKESEKIQLTAAWMWRMYQLLSLIATHAVRLLSAHQRRVVSEGRCCGTSTNIDSDLARSNFSVVLLRLVMQDARKVVSKVCGQTSIQRDQTFTCASNKGRRTRSDKESA